MFDLFNELEKLLKQKHSNSFINQTLNGNVDMCINTYKRQVYIRTFESDDTQTDSIALLILKDKRFAITDDIQLNSDCAYETAFEDAKHTNICFKYDNVYQLLANFNKVLEIAEHIANNELL